MDLSMLLSQAQMSYSKMNFYKNPKSSKKINNQELFVKVFEQNLDSISSYLNQKDIYHLRLLCRGVGYLFIVRDLWSGMKVQVAEKKFQDIEDYEFVEEEPKQISKQDKKIRIHSLKKNMANSVSKKATRQASNIKEKKLSMAVIDNELNPFQKTQIGFKRLLKSNNSSLIKTSTKMKQKNVDIEENMSIQRLPELLQIPKEYSIDDLLINPRDQWVKNMHRANNLISLVRRWNSFHQRFWVYVSKQESELIILMKKMIKLDGCLLSYKTTIQEQPVNTIVKIIEESAPKNALIEDQLNKLGKQFISAHNQMKDLLQNKEAQKLITALHECYQKMSQKSHKKQIQPTTWVQGLTIIDEAFDNILNKLSHGKLKSSLIKSITNIFRQLLNQHLSKIVFFEEKTTMKCTTLKFIIENSQFCQLSFQIIYSLIGKITTSLQTLNQKISISNSSIKMGQSGSNFSKKLKPVQKSNQIKMLSTLSKFTQSKENTRPSKSQKTLFGILWNISKYFDKLQKQLALKQKKKKEQQKVNLIKNFIQNQSTIINQKIYLICTQQNEEVYLKSLSLIEDYYKEFKVKIEKLKDQMAKTVN